VPDDGIIQGMVLVAGKPIDTGRVVLHAADGQFRGGQIAKGTFSLRGLPFGKYRLTFEGDNVPANKFDAEIDRNCKGLSGTFSIR
jgi:hypothetical protein